MTAPNLLDPSSIVGKTTYLTLADTNETDLLVNASGSDTAMRVTNLMAANIDGSGAADITATLYTAASGGTGYAIASTVSVPADSTMVILTRENGFWLEEDRRITVQASASGDLSVICSYEEVT